MTTIARQASGSALLAAVFLSVLTARRLGIASIGGAGGGLDVLLLFAGVCCGGAAVIIVLLHGPARATNDRGE